MEIDRPGATKVVLLSGVTVSVKVAHVRLCHSRMLFVRAYPRETQEMVFDAHDRAFVLFKGTCGRGIYDNMKTAVETVFVGKDRLYNRRFLQMCSHYLVEPVASRGRRAGRRGRSRTRSGWCVSASSRRGCGSRTSMNGTPGCLIDASPTPRPISNPEFADKTIWEAFEAERPKLVPYVGRFDGFHAVPASVSKTCLVRFDNNKYSVAAGAVARSRSRPMPIAS
jgi:hypothetical protein